METSDDPMAVDAQQPAPAMVQPTNVDQFARPPLPPQLLPGIVNVAQLLVNGGALPHPQIHPLTNGVHGAHDSTETRANQAVLFAESVGASNPPNPEAPSGSGINGAAPVEDPDAPPQPPRKKRGRPPKSAQQARSSSADPQPDNDDDGSEYASSSSDGEFQESAYLKRRRLRTQGDGSDDEAGGSDNEAAKSDPEDNIVYPSELPPRTRRRRGRPPRAGGVSDRRLDGSGSGVEGVDGAEAGDGDGEGGLVPPTGNHIPTPFKRRRGRPPKNGFSARPSPAPAPAPKRPPDLEDDPDWGAPDDKDEWEPDGYDEKGEEKVDRDGNLTGGRQYRCRVFTLPRHPTRLWMFTIDVARMMGYRDSHILYFKHKDFPRVVCTLRDKNHLVDLGFLIPQLKSRNVNLLPARVAFKRFGYEVIRRGKIVRDDYFVGDRVEPPDSEVPPLPDDFFVSHMKPMGARLGANPAAGEDDHRSGTTGSAWRAALPRLGPGAGVADKWPGYITKSAAQRNVAQASESAADFNRRLRLERDQKVAVGRIDPHTGVLHWPKLLAPVKLTVEMEAGKLGGGSLSSRVKSEPVMKILEDVVVRGEKERKGKWVKLEPDVEDEKYPLAIMEGQYQGMYSLFPFRFGMQHLLEGGAHPEQPASVFLPQMGQLGQMGPMVQMGSMVPGMPGSSLSSLPPTPASPYNVAVVNGQFVNICGYTRSKGGVPCKRIVAKQGDRCLYHADNSQLLEGIRAGTVQAAAAAAASTTRKGPEPTKPCVDCGSLEPPEPREDVTEPVSDLLLRCAVCKNAHHAYCAELYAPPLLAKVTTYPWQCNDCKLCVICREAGDESKLLMCDDCDRGYHTYCLTPKLNETPQDAWACHLCASCWSCGATGKPIAWFHHATVPNVAKPGQPDVYFATYCPTCYAHWEAERFCPVCGKVYAADNNDLQMVCCDLCDRWVHVDCDTELTPERYEKLSEDPNAKYACPLHSPKVERVLSSEMAKGVYKRRYGDVRGKKTFLPPAAAPRPAAS
ncbi:hypothetical protein M427DRAFT_59713 [Gonapodya prolifera JEL478]|uniref:PHD-type domain-containing protein n=1 Tax=Gonapodya prolifera (strain JEL478) TaxID=1344416 RepID=A0A139A6X2_GONPJ|nr:hypothetical protein M427DRAFT_59713 [Gonapodya prolifera JEL478]|eukprot:KXS12195.1 hypothetical protein M427DRAFT_59713 [Gonapodya prolifera JEL478]